MARDEEFRAVVDGFRQATDGLSARIQRLIDQAAAGGLSAVQEDAFLAELTVIKDNLAAMGQDPDNPIPPAPPAPEEPTGDTPTGEEQQ